MLFIWDRWRYDLVALLALLALTLTGVIPADQAFSGFGHPAVITVAAVLVLGRGLSNSGVVGVLSWLLNRIGDRPTVQVACLCLACALVSSFMNNVGALALLMPVALEMARRRGTSPSLLLMPLAFASLLGGLTTLIGTPPNIIIAGFRAEATGQPYGLFDFAPVGLGLMLVGIAFMALVGWRLLPVRRGQASAEEMFEVEVYTTELQVPGGSPLDGRPLTHLHALSGIDLVVAAVVRGEQRIFAPSGNVLLAAGDALIVEIDPQRLRNLVQATGLVVESHRSLGTEAIRGGETALLEAVVVPAGRLVGRSPRELQLRAEHGLNLLAVSRHGTRIGGRLRDLEFEAGDVLLLQSANPGFREALAALGALPLAPRPLQLGTAPRRLLTAGVIFGAALTTLISGLLPAQSAFVAAAVAMILSGLVTLREAYRHIEWPILVLLGAMLPVGQALETTGGAAWIATHLANVAGAVPLPLTLAFVLLITMSLTDIMNNAATAVIMAPIAMGIADVLDVSADPFLMAIAVGASCAFLTPIGHQSNTLVMGPGGYRFGDYWRLGLPLEILLVLLAVPLLLWAWPP